MAPAQEVRSDALDDFTQRRTLQAPILGLGGNAQLTSLLPLQTGKIFQRFSSLADGRVDNIIQLSVPYLLQEGGGVCGHACAD